jgi:hypothetical protein
MLYAMTHTGFFFSLLCLGSGMCTYLSFVFYADLDTLSAILEASLGGPLDILFCLMTLGTTLCVILFALFIRDSPEANVHLITGCAAIVFWVLLVVSLICAWRIYI